MNWKEATDYQKEKTGRRKKTKKNIYI